MSISMENPPDLIVAVTSDDQYQDKKKIFIENIFQQQNKQHDILLSNSQSNKYNLEGDFQQLKNQLIPYNNNEFTEQSYLLQQRFQDEIQSMIYHHNELIEHVTSDLSTYVTNILQKSITNIESLRLLHQKELCTNSKPINDCIQHQSCEMNELYQHLIDQQYINPMNLLNKLIDNFQIELNNLKTSFNSKINYLNDIHSSTIDKLNIKHETEMNEIKCELNLVTSRQN